MTLNILIVEGNNSEDSEIFIKAAGSTAADNLRNLVTKLEAKSNIKIIKICDYLELNNCSFDGFINWILDLRKKLDMPHKLSEVIDEKDFDLDRLSKMALADPSTGGNPKKLTEADMKIMYQHSMSGELFK